MILGVTDYTDRRRAGRTFDVGHSGNRRRWLRYMEDAGRVDGGEDYPYTRTD